MPPDDRARSARPASLLAALSDLKFERQVTPILVRWVYVGALGVVGLGILFGLLLVWSLASWMGWGMWLAAPIVVGAGLIAVLVVRIGCEWVLARFRRSWPVTPSQGHTAPPPQVHR
ncbi:DUF4282 domain-containing protein [Actinomadura vinacea]